MFTWKGRSIHLIHLILLTNEDFVNLKIRHNNVDYYTDTSGNTILSSSNGQATYYLEGLYTQVMTNGSTPNFNISASVPSVSFDNSNSTISEEQALWL